jgi:hypothetical protein
VKRFRFDSAVSAGLYCGIVLAGFSSTILVLTAQDAPKELALIIFGLFACGLAFLLVAKTSMFRRGIMLSFGSGGMSPWNRRAYRAGYALILLGVLAAVVLIYVVSRLGGPPA